MEFLTVIVLVDAFHHTNKIEAKQKGKSHFMNKQTGRSSDKKSSANSDKVKHPSQPNLVMPNHHKKNFKKDKKDCNK